MVAPTPPEFVLSSRIAHLCVRIQRRRNGVDVERLQAPQLDQINVVSFGLDIGDRHLRLLHAMEVRQNRDSLLVGDRLRARLVDELALVERVALVEGNR